MGLVPGENHIAVYFPGSGIYNPENNNSPTNHNMGLVPGENHHYLIEGLLVTLKL